MNFRKKRGCGHPAVTVEPPSPATQRCTDGAPRGQAETQTQRGGRRKSEVNEAGRAKKLGRISVTFVSTLFEIDDI